MRNKTLQTAFLVFLSFLFVGFISYVGADTATCDLGPTNTNTSMNETSPNVADGDTVGATDLGRNHRNLLDPNVDHYMYFQVADTFAYQGNHPAVTVSVVYYDTAGSVQIKLQYDATTSAYKTHATIYTTGGTSTWKTATWSITDAYFGNRENNSSDMRININSPNQANIDSITVTYSVAPGSTLLNKVVAGYQGWYRCPGDGSGSVWRHWSKSTSTIDPTNFQIDEWPDMSSYTTAEKFRAGTVMTLGGQPAYLFSSVNAATVNRHFAWMQQYGIDGILLQRFLPVETGHNTVVTNVKNAAGTYGRLWTVEWDVHNLTNANLYSSLTSDWSYFVNTVGIKTNPNVLKENGKVVVAIYGLAVTSLGFSTATANSVIDYFKNDGEYVYGGVPANWNSSTAGWTTAWSAHFDKYDAIQAWMPGTSSWTNDIARCNNHGQQYFGHVWPGFSWAHLKNLSPTDPSFKDRTGGTFMTTKSNGLKTAGCDRAFIGMFDECDESTAILPMTDDHPAPRSATQGNFIGNQGQTADHWMSLAGTIW